MGKYLITTGDFLKNAGIVGLYYILKEYKFNVIEGREYGIKEQGGKEYDFEAYESGLWLDEDFIENADWTDMFFKACVSCYRDSTVYARVLDNIDVIIDKINNGTWQKNTEDKEMLDFISDKLLSNSYKSGFDNIKNEVENVSVYENLQKEKLSFKLNPQDGTKIYDISNELFGLNTSRADKTRMILEKLSVYEDLEEQGRLIKLPVKVDTAEYRECVHTKSQCHHENCKCSECPLTELFCDEFYKAIDRCYEDAYASGCLAGIELGKTEAEAKLKELRGGENANSESKD